MVNRFGRLITASFFVMGFGILLFLLTPLLYGLWQIDSDLPGLLIVDIGLVILIIGIIRRNKMKGFKLAVMVVLASVLSIPVLMAVVSTVYYLVTGKPMGN
jgi:hypothetical protein